MTDTNGNGHLPQRGAHWKNVPDIPPSDRDAAKELLRPGLERWCRNVLAGLEKGNRTSMHLYAKAMELVGAEVEVNVALTCIRAFGMPQEEVAAVLESHRRSADTSIAQCVDDGVALLKWAIAQEPQRRQEILAALGGENALAVDETNGHH